MVINLFGAPGCGKSTAAAGLFYELKKKDFSCELVTEYAKDLVYSGHLKESDQVDIFMEQYRRTKVAYEKVDFVITDSPLRISEIYDNTKIPAFKPFVREISRRFVNFNILLQRKHAFKEEGRIHNEIEAKIIHEKIYTLIMGESITLDSLEVVDCLVRLFDMRRREGTDYANYVQY